MPTHRDRRGRAEGRPEEGSGLRQLASLEPLDECERVDRRPHQGGPLLADGGEDLAGVHVDQVADERIKMLGLDAVPRQCGIRDIMVIVGHDDVRLSPNRRSQDVTIVRVR